MYVQFTEKLVINFAYDLATFLFENSCCGFLETLFSWQTLQNYQLKKKTHGNGWTQQSCKRASFRSLNLARKHKTKPDLIPTIIFEARFGPWKLSLTSDSRLFDYSQVISFYWRCIQFDCFNSNWRQNVRRCEKILYAGPKSLETFWQTWPRTRPETHPDPRKAKIAKSFNCGNLHNHKGLRMFGMKYIFCWKNLVLVTKQVLVVN